MEATYNSRSVRVVLSRRNGGPARGTTMADVSEAYKNGYQEVLHGFAEDSFIAIQEKGNGIVSKVGCDGEVIRSIDPNYQHTIQFSLLQNSGSNNFLHRCYIADRNHGRYGRGDGVFKLTITDLSGQVVFACSEAWVAKETNITFGRDTNAKQWTIETNIGHYKVDGDDFKVVNNDTLRSGNVNADKGGWSYSKTQ